MIFQAPGPRRQQEQMSRIRPQKNRSGSRLGPSRNILTQLQALSSLTAQAESEMFNLTRENLFAVNQSFLAIGQVLDALHRSCSPEGRTDVKNQTSEK